VNAAARARRSTSRELSNRLRRTFSVRLMSTLDRERIRTFLRQRARSTRPGPTNHCAVQGRWPDDKRARPRVHLAMTREGFALLPIPIQFGATGR
jgi:hypothetical protein